MAGAGRSLCPFLHHCPLESSVKWSCKSVPQFTPYVFLSHFYTTACSSLCPASFCTPSSHIQMWESDHKEGWVLKTRCFQIVVLEKTLESPLDSKEIQPVNPKGNKSWLFTGKTDAEAEAPILWPPDAKNGLIGKDPDAGKDWRQEEKGTTEDEMVGWHHLLDGQGFEKTPRDSEGQGSLECHRPWGHNESDMT